MERNTSVFYLVLTLMFTASMVSQDQSGSDDIAGDEAIEKIIDRGPDQEDVQSTVDELEYYRSHPVDVARPVYSELIQLPMISPMLAESIILLSDTVDITDVEQIRSAGLMNEIIFEQIKPFVSITAPNESFSFLPEKFESRTRMENRIRKSNGYMEGKYGGNSSSSYQRIKMSGVRTEASALFEKDPGELATNGFITGSVSLKNTGYIKRIVLGDYSVAADQGLIFAKNISSSKGSDVIGQIKKKGRIVTPNTSADELHYFRGTAIESNDEDISMVGFYSERKLPASVDTNGEISSLYSAGLFRNASELKKKNVVRETAKGTRVEFDLGDNRNISLSYLTVRYDHSYTQSYELTDRKQSLNAGSMAFDIPGRFFTVFGQIASSDVKNFSYSGGVVTSISKSFSLSYHLRHFAIGYTTPFARPFGEKNNIAEGEDGNYVGLAYSKDRVSLNGYYDRALFPAIHNDFSGLSAESFLSIECPLTKKCGIYVHMRNKVQSKLTGDDENDIRRQANYRFEFRIKMSRNITLTNRIETASISYEPSSKKESGLMMFADGSYREYTAGMRFKFRLIFFDSPSYDSRLYQYESDVTGNYSNPPLYGKGIRWYILFGYELFDDVVCSFKYSETKKLNVLTIGSGDDEIIGNIDGQMAFQLDFQL